MFMTPPFLALMGDFEETIRQVDCYRGFLWKSDKKLFAAYLGRQEKGLQA